MKDIDISLPTGMVSSARTRGERVAYLDGMARALLDAYFLLADAGKQAPAVGDIMVKLHRSAAQAQTLAAKTHNYRRRKVGGGRR